jgi:hypothetical protein
MEKLLFVIGLIALMSCDKEVPGYCWQCNKEIFADHAYSSHITIICDKTEKEIYEYEKMQSREIESQSMVIVMTCKLID